MPAPWLAILVKTVPWVELARRSPEIIDASRKLLDKTRSVAERQSDPRGRSSPLELAERVRLLEQRDVEHAKIVEQVVEQLQGLTDALQVLEARTRRLTYALAGAVLLVVVAGLFVLATR
jgi:hypothetical protein